MRPNDPVLNPMPGKPLLNDTLVSDLIQEVALSGRAYDVLHDGLPWWDEANRVWAKLVLTTVGDVRRLSDAEILRVPNIGRKTLRELREACGDTLPFDPVKHRLTMVEALGVERADIIVAMRSLASNLQRLAALIEEAGRKGKL